VQHVLLHLLDREEAVERVKLARTEDLPKAV
jgi:hypothetical protein